jgi:hypothetical protein
MTWDWMRSSSKTSCRNRVSDILGPATASPSDTQGESRMPVAGTTVLCGGRSVMAVPTVKERMRYPSPACSCEVQIDGYRSRLRALRDGVRSTYPTQIGVWLLIMNKVRSSMSIIDALLEVNPNVLRIRVGIRWCRPEDDRAAAPCQSHLVAQPRDLTVGIAHVYVISASRASDRSSPSDRYG